MAENEKKENLEWQKRDNLNFTNILDQIGDLTKIIVNRELDDINGRLVALQRMGFIKDKKTMCQLQKRISSFKTKSQVNINEDNNEKDGEDK